MRKNSKVAKTLHQLTHQIMVGVATNDTELIRASLSRACEIDHDHFDRYGTTYHRLWIVQIALQHPDALEASPKLNEFVLKFLSERRAFNRGRRDSGLHDRVHGNPYCAYTEESLHEQWTLGWDDRFNDLH